MSILLLTATAMEGDRLLPAIEDRVEQRVFGRRWLSGLWQETPLRLVEGGLGAVNTAHALTRALQMDLPRVVCQIGVGGAYPGAGLDVGALALARNDTYADLGVGAPDGFHDASLIGIPVAGAGDEALFNRYPCDDEKTTAVETRLREAGENVVAGPFVTVQEVSGTTELGAQRLHRVPGAICESMEGAAAAHLCALYGVPFVELRGISNLVEDRDLSTWDLPGACEAAARAVPLILGDLAA